ncbi:MAG TPA: PDZ domain-containing protein [Gemmatimonadaceae bacterium]
MKSSRAACAARIALVVAAVLVNGTRIVKAQPTVAGPPPPGPIGSLGLSDVECDCTFSSGEYGEARTFHFRSYPIVLRVRSGSAGSGILHRGDTIVDIDGLSLRSDEGGRRFANVRPGVATRLGVRRDGRYLRVTVVPTAITRAQASQLGEYSPRVTRPRRSVDEDDEWSPPSASAIPAAPRAPRAVRTHPPAVASTPPQPAVAARAMVTPPPTPTAAQAEAAAVAAVPAVPTIPAVPESPASPRGWFGFSIRCSQCGWSRSGNEEYPRWESETNPEVTRVAPDGPAAAAGILSGDLITHVDGISILTREGGKKFGALQPGQRVRLGLLRGGVPITRELRLARRPGFASESRPLRYSGKVRDVSIEVWSGSGTTAEQVGDTLIITIGNSVVRLKGVGKK